MRSATIPLNLFPVNVIMIVIAIAKSMFPSQPLNAAASIAANLNRMDGIGDRREGVDHATCHVGIVRCWESCQSIPTP